MTTHAPCPTHDGQHFHRSTGACSCGSSHAATVTTTTPVRLTPDQYVKLDQIAASIWQRFGDDIAGAPDTLEALDLIVDTMADLLEACPIHRCDPEICADDELECVGRPWSCPVCGTTNREHFTVRDDTGAYIACPVSPTTVDTARKV